MRKINYIGWLIALIVFFQVSIPCHAQYGNTVRPERIWNNIWENQSLYHWNDITYNLDSGYHFEGEREADGKRYAVYRDGSNREVALLREEEGRVYIHLAPGMYKSEGYPDQVVTEGLLYDFNAKAGETIRTVYSEFPDFVEYNRYLDCEMTVVETFKVRVAGELMRGLHVRCNAIDPVSIDEEMIIIEGIGSNYGRLNSPQLSCPVAGEAISYGFIDNVTDGDGKIIFIRYDFLRFYKYAEKEYREESPSLVREDRVWNYDVKSFLGSALEYTYEENNFRFTGKKDLDGNSYAVFVHGDTDNVSYMREDGDKVYLYLTDDLIEGLQDYDAANGREVLLYDFTAETGDTFVSITFDEVGHETSAYAIVTVKSKGTITINGEEVVCQTLEYCPGDNEKAGYICEAIEGIGVSRGRLDRPQCGYLTSGMHYTYSLLRTVTNEDGELIFDGKNFADDPSGIKATETENDCIGYYDSVVTANSTHILICDLSGKCVAWGLGSVSTAGLQRGVYVARAAGQSLKIVVK